MTGRRWGLFAFSLVFLGYALGQEWIQIHWDVDENHLLDLLVGVSAALSGVVALDRRPGNAIGWLLVGMGVAWFANPYVLLDIPVVTVVAPFVASLSVPLIGHLVLAYPSGRLQSRFEAVLVLTMYGTTLALTLVQMAVFDPRAWGCTACVWRPAIWPSATAVALVERASDVVITALVVAFTIAVVLRFRRSSRVERRDLSPLWVGAILLGIIEVIGALGEVGTSGFMVLLWEIRSVLLILVPLVFLYGLLTDRTARSAIGDLVLRLEHDIPAGQLGSILSDSLGDPSLRIVYAAASGEGWVTAEGVPTDDPATREDRNHGVTVIRRDHRPYAALIHDRALSQTLVTGVASAAALAIENEWLHAELRAQLDEVRASRARIIAAGDEERRKVERDLHDGAQQRLLALSLALRAARRQVETAHGPQVLEPLDRAEHELKLAITELRELARGIHPTILTDEGLEAAVRSLAARATLPVIVSVNLFQRLAPGLEATAYFAVSEALANVSKHAGATRATVAVRVDEGTLRITVADDGSGGADPRRGSGLRGLHDRVSAAEGSIEVISPPGQGTALEIAIPLPGPPTTPERPTTPNPLAGRLSSTLPVEP